MSAFVKMLWGGRSPPKSSRTLLRPDVAIEGRQPNGPDNLNAFCEHSALRVGAEQEQLAFGDPVSGSGAAEPLSNRRRKHGKADGEACSPGLLGQSFAAGNHLVLRSRL